MYNWLLFWSYTSDKIMESALSKIYYFCWINLKTYCLYLYWFTYCIIIWLWYSEEVVSKCMWLIQVYIFLWLVSFIYLDSLNLKKDNIKNNNLYLCECHLKMYFIEKCLYFNDTYEKFLWWGTVKNCYVLFFKNAVVHFNCMQTNIN